MPAETSGGAMLPLEIAFIGRCVFSALDGLIA